MAKSACRACKRNVVMVEVNGDLVATDPEVLQGVQATYVPGHSGSGVRMSDRVIGIRRLHAEQCQSYQDQARRERIAAEMRAFNKKNGRAPRRNQGL